MNNTEKNESIKLLMADDHKLVRDGFKLLIRKHKRIKLLGEAENGFELIEMAHELQPDVIVADIEMPGMDGIEATKRLTVELPGIGIIALSMFASPIRIEEIIEAGARGYLMKNAEQEEMLAGIEAVNEGAEFFCSETMKVLDKEQLYKSGKHMLTWREITIIRLLCDEKSNKEIAAQLNLSPRTVEGYRDSIMHKIHVINVAGIALYATRNNLL